MPNINIDKVTGLTWEDLHLLELAAKLDGCETVEGFVLKSSILLAEEIVGDDIERVLCEDE
jgi:uncharacterized protein (DUF1778 family)